ncbi:helix-turn-helix domain-containing protein [Glaesserella parasuis]|uniref:helix-turn-helix domain-containing protein n=1 Tax=Glaesserella parasuis TaxID=738 RepID=UPI00136658A7|nr:helix-turn-helix transcriptional regulator [Glaesserella parasuis]MCT8543003.1 helix-turn-helix transcriptional regulator [Glaesserella parasuis]MCT8573755.1 helix-turn-helix transcriptional regulator [Glaesserella parasuis]MCT8582413.1 helix-turn-helix transcriptional regulator [Glaesserella parasuis]MCT8586535.1 helix-turn-helix transcriptional regulator [Glaesserella parasuis]MCT8654336.1 helix-turn-helix transcriptional regulator [Glaesserella parasuis]
MFLQKLGLTIKEARKNYGLSQEQLALKINMDRTYLASVEAGKRNISILNLKKISEGLDMSLDQLLVNL